MSYKYQISRPSDKPLGMLHPLFTVQLDRCRSQSHYVCAQLVISDNTLVTIIQNSPDPYTTVLELLQTKFKEWVKAYLVHYKFTYNGNVKVDPMFYRTYAVFECDAEYVESIVTALYTKTDDTQNTHDPFEGTRTTVVQDKFGNFAEYVFYHLSVLFGLIGSKNILGLFKMYSNDPLEYMKYILEEACIKSYNMKFLSQAPSLYGIENIIHHLQMRSGGVTIKSPNANVLQEFVDEFMTLLIKETKIPRIRIDNSIRIIEFDTLTPATLTFCQTKLDALYSMLEAFKMLKPQDENDELINDFTRDILESCGTNRNIIFPIPRKVRNMLGGFDKRAWYDIRVFLATLMDIMRGHTFRVRDVVTMKNVLYAIGNVYKMLYPYKIISIRRMDTIRVIGQILGLDKNYEYPKKAPGYVYGEMEKYVDAANMHKSTVDNLCMLVYVLHTGSYNSIRIRSRIDFFG